MALAISIFFRVLALAAALVLLPWGMGCLFLHKGEFDDGFVYLFGLCALFTGFELLYLPFFVVGRSFGLMTALFFVLASAAALAGLFLRAKQAKRPRAGKAPLSRREKVFTAVFACVALWQILRAVLGGGTWNIDDGWYLALANTTMYDDLIMRTDPLTGEAFNYFAHMGEYSSYVFSPWPLFWAMFAQLFEFSITVLMRTVMPGFFISLFYFLVYRFARFFFRGEREKALFALMGLSIFFEICGVAMNLRFTWIICYPWMGKGFGASIVSPLALYFFLLIEDEGDKRRRRLLWLAVFFANVAGCMAASTCAELTLMLLGAWGLVYILRRRDWSAVWKLGLCCLPSLALMAAHLL